LIEVFDLSKAFKEVIAVDKISFKVKKGEVFGLLGLNGAGKTTTLRMLSTVYRPSAGTATINGHDIVKDVANVRECIGVVSENPGLYDRLTPRETIRFYGRLYRLSNKEIDRRIEEIFEQLQMNDFANRRCEKLSKGMKQKVVVARALIHDPPVLMFDEPTSGLDILSARTVIDSIKESKIRGKTVIFSSHIMHIAEEVCDRICVINKGRVITEGSVRNVIGKERSLEAYLLKRLSPKELNGVGSQV